MKKIIAILFTVSCSISACSILQENQTTTCQDGEVLIIKKGQFYPYTYTLTEIRDGSRKPRAVGGNYGHNVYIPKDKLEDYVLNPAHAYYKDGDKVYNDTAKAIRVYKWYDERKKAEGDFRAKTYQAKGQCFKRDDLIYIDIVLTDIDDIER